jgi:hypothetical protein
MRFKSLSDTLRWISRNGGSRSLLTLLAGACLASLAFLACLTSESIRAWQSCSAAYRGSLGEYAPPLFGCRQLVLAPA